VSILSALQEHLGPKRSEEFQSDVSKQFLDAADQTQANVAIRDGGVLFSDLTAATLSMLALASWQSDPVGAIIPPPKRNFAELLLGTNDLVARRLSGSARQQGADPWARSRELQHR
jgi:hypothetical protein